MNTKETQQLTLDHFPRVKAALNAALRDIQNPDIAAITQIAKENPDAWPIAAKRIAEVIGEQIKNKVDAGASVDEEMAVRNWAAQFLEAIGIPVVRRLSREEITNRRKDPEIISKPIKQETRFASYEAFIAWVNQNAETFTPQEAMQILVVVYNAGKFLPGKLSDIFNRRVISQEEMPLVVSYLKNPGLGEIMF